ncbi:MAG: hypothetical protein H6Q74_2883 [Firmicutes bacterium]|nr:hypothetical protein [Bacillota bacterium]
MKKIATAILFLLIMQISSIVSAQPSAEKENYAKAKPFQIYYVPTDNPNSNYRMNIYRAKIIPGSVNKGDQLTTRPVKGDSTYTFYITDVHGDIAELLLEYGPKKEISLFTPLVQLEM